MDLFSSEPEGQDPQPQGPLSVAQACELLKESIARINDAQPIEVMGEISEFRPRGANAHWYFSLRDEDGSTLNCAFFTQRRVRSNLDFEPTQGMMIVAEGTFDYYAPYGKLSFIVRKLSRHGVGPLHEQFQKLRREFQEAGWFDDDQKLPIPEFPQRIAVLTSSQGAVRHDIETTARSRWGGIELVLVPIPVQGESAAPQIAQAIRAIQSAAPSMGIDAIILARGGGSLEDLWAFNTREVVEAIHESRIKAIARGNAVPLVAGIGHESDTTLAELVSDRRASTPTQAAMILVPSADELEQYLDARLGRLRTLHASALKHASARLAAAMKHPIMRRSEIIFQPHVLRIDEATRALRGALEEKVVQQQLSLSRLQGRLSAASPAAQFASAGARVQQQASRLARELQIRLETLSQATEARARHLAAIGPGQVLARGYSITLDENGRALREATDVQPGAEIRSRFATSELRSQVLKQKESASSDGGE